MIDMDASRTLHQQDSVQPIRDDLGLDVMVDDEPPEDSFTLLLPSKIKGYEFHYKKWVTLSVDRIRDISWNKEAFASLILPEQKKQLIHALETVHMATNQMSDIIEGKSNGLIILSHGSPGSGKTLTAESVAEIAERPLYRATCGDIGTNPIDVEQYLETIFNIGSTWGCVVLLDEVDVFLEKCSKIDLERNALVSVFLWALEYYEGIIILTSNRVGTFDEAFKSRIQLAMYYPPLDQSDRLKIWQQIFSVLDAAPGQHDTSDLHAHAPALTRVELKGRQIRNTVKTAEQVAIYLKE